MKFSNDDLKRWKAEINAGAVISTRITLRREGREYVGLCPFHQEDSPSFKVYVQDDSTWGYKCFGCGKNGNVFQFIQQHDKITFTEAVEKVLEIAGISGWENGKKQVDATFGRILDNQKELRTFPYETYKNAEVSFAGSIEAQNWIIERGITVETAQRFHIGFVQSASVISDNHPWVNDGWILFPTLSVDGETVLSVKYRSLKGKKGEEGEGEGKKNWSGILRAPNTATVLFNLREVNPMEDVFIVEGEPDTLVLSQTGVPTVGLPSAQYSPNPDERMTLMRARRRFLAGDNDEVGNAAMDKLWKEFRDRTYRIRWPNNLKDANDVLIREFGGNVDKFCVLMEQLKNEALKQPIPDYYDMAEVMDHSDTVSMLDSPRRLHCRTKEVDEMAITVPGNLVSVFATFTGSGKTTWVMDEIALYEAMKFGSVVVNYSAELSPQEYSTLVASNLTGKDRLGLLPEDYKKAASELQATHARFYVGYNPDLDRIGKVLDSLEWAIRVLGANIVILDHLHFLARGERDDIKAQADAMQRMKNLCRKYDVIFIVVGQSRKRAQGSRGKSSDSEDAKGSETFTSDATTTYHIHRARKQNIDWDRPDTWPNDLLENKTEIRLDKCRTKGPGKAVALQIFNGSIGKFFPFTNQLPMAPEPEVDYDGSFADAPDVGGFNV